MAESRTATHGKAHDVIAIPGLRPGRARTAARVNTLFIFTLQSTDDHHRRPFSPETLTPARAPVLARQRPQLKHTRLAARMASPLDHRYLAPS